VQVAVVKAETVLLRPVHVLLPVVQAPMGTMVGMVVTRVSEETGVVQW
jgi:hypothetical protein